MRGYQPRGQYRQRAMKDMVNPQPLPIKRTILTVINLCRPGIRRYERVRYLLLRGVNTAGKIKRGSPTLFVRDTAPRWMSRATTISEREVTTRTRHRMVTVADELGRRAQWDCAHRVLTSTGNGERER
jgi:hypothetical protein